MPLRGGALRNLDRLSHPSCIIVNQFTLLRLSTVGLRFLCRGPCGFAVVELFNDLGAYPIEQLLREDSK